MKRYWNLREKMWTMGNLYEAHRMARKDKRLYKEVQMVDGNPDYYLGKIREMMLYGKYHISPEDYSVSIIRDKTKQRELWKLKYYPHRIIQWAVMLQIEKVFNRTFCTFVCASIKGKWWNWVMHLMNKYMKDTEGTKYCLKLDIKKFYPSINHRLLKKLLRKKFKDKKLLSLLDMIIDSFPWRKGLPIWSYLSQFLANYYLAFFDHWLKEELKCKYVIRYMDDIVILAESKKHLRYIYKRIKAYLWWNLCLHIKDNRQVFPTWTRGIDFVGYRYFYRYILLRKSTCKKFKKKARQIKYKQDRGRPLTERERAWINSYAWWLSRCNSWRLYEKYIQPYLPSIVWYYREFINERKYVSFWKRIFKLKWRH